MRRRWLNGLCLCAVLLTAAGGALAREATLVMQDGRRIKGELVNETADSVTIKIADQEATFPRNRIQEIQIRLTLAEQYEQKRAAIQDSDINARYELARWLAEQDTAAGYRLAIRELDSILKDNPDYQLARLLKNVARERLEKAEAEQKPAVPEEATPAEPAPGPERAGGEVELLGEEQINLIKAFELDLQADPIILFPRETVDELFEQYGDDPKFEQFRGPRGRQRFMALSGAEQMGWLFTLQARDLYDDVVIRNDPPTMRTFRTQVYTGYALRYCGRCHGEGRAPGLHVVTRRPVADNVVYTNYLILRRTKVGRTPLIDKADPEGSPLLQYGLPEMDAATPHPQTPGWRPYFNGANDPRFVEMARWVRQLWGDTEDYPIEFEPPAAEGDGADNPAAAEGGAGAANP